LFFYSVFLSCNRRIQEAGLPCTLYHRLVPPMSSIIIASRIYAKLVIIIWPCDRLNLHIDKDQRVSIMDVEYETTIRIRHSQRQCTQVGSVSNGAFGLYFFPSASASMRSLTVLCTLNPWQCCCGITRPLPMLILRKFTEISDLCRLEEKTPTGGYETTYRRRSDSEASEEEIRVSTSTGRASAGRR
jgi:hypothetical protein